MEGSPEILAEVPIVDFSLLKQNDHLRSSVIEKIFDACSRYGYFQVTNHGIADSVMAEAVDANFKFFEMGMEAKEELTSNDIYRAVRFGKVQIGEFSRELLKLYAHPLHQFIDSWPRFPSDYRQKMGAYTMEARKLSIELFGAIIQSLHINAAQVKQNFEQGCQIIGINCYPSTSGAAKTGLPPHTDHGIITVLLQSAAGLRVIHGGSWKNVPTAKGSLMVLVGDHLEVISNGVFKSVLHEPIPRCSEGMRVLVASLHSLGMDDIVEPAPELLCDGNPGMYKGSSLRDFLGHLASGDKRPFIQTLKKNSNGLICISKVGEKYIF